MLTVSRPHGWRASMMSKMVFLGMIHLSSRARRTTSVDPLLMAASAASTPEAPLPMMTTFLPARDVLNESSLEEWTMRPWKSPELGNSRILGAPQDPIDAICTSGSDETNARGRGTHDSVKDSLSAVVDHPAGMSSLGGRLGQSGVALNLLHLGLYEEVVSSSVLN